MSKPSNEVILRHLKKAYSQWNIRIKKDEFEKIEAIRSETGLSRLEFFKMLVKEKYGDIL
ncbi:MAG: hypothetical protein IJS61_03425 [Firmicutes bacterium]|nr:hypothetical protein [Bacillota bacterium]